MSDDAKRELVELLARHDVPLIEDDVYGDLAHDGTRPRPAKSFDRKGLVLWCSSFSKTAAPGLRVGWIAAGRYQAEIEHRQFTTSVGPSPLPQAIMAEFLTTGGYDRFLRRARTMYGERTAAMADAVLSVFPAGTRVTRPAAGFALWVELPRGIDAQALYAAALPALIAITPGPLFSAKLRYRHFIRLNAAQWRDPWKEHLGRLAALARKLDRG
jgi:DNA-binding transcriptional MocR family regulator